MNKTIAKKIAILGFARDARPLIGLLRRRPEYRGAEIWILDRNEKLAIPRGVRARLGENYLDDLADFDLIFRTPGIPYNLPELLRALKRGVTISSSTKLFFEEIEKIPRARRPVVVGVTGTKGKSTTATLIYKMLIAAKRKARLGGNIGVSPLAALSKLDVVSRNDADNPKSVIVLEMSSFQLQDLAASPDIAVVLEMFPDHQDVHRDLKEYYGAKANIVRHQKSGDTAFYFPDNRVTKKTAAHGRGKKIAVGERGFALFTPADLLIPGRHNFRNAMMAARVARQLGVSDAVIARTVKTFTGLDHRLQFVRNVRGVLFYNDSAAHNPSAAAAAIRSFPGAEMILIAGGKDRNIDFAPLDDAIRKGKNVSVVVLYGENKGKIRRAIGKSGAAIVLVSTLRQAVAAAYRAAKQRGAGIVLFSPGSASFDQYRDYVARGEDFVRVVKSLK